MGIYGQKEENMAMNLHGANLLAALSQDRELGFASAFRQIMKDHAE